MDLGNKINNLRKSKGYSQEYLAEQINVSRQTISNWELGETSPNPEQLLLLSKTFEVSVDNLLGNEIKYENNKSNKNIYVGAMIICGCITGVWSFTTNRFRYDEMIFITAIGVAIGFGIALIINGILKKINSKN